jgi:uncharacterized protein
VTTAAPIRSAPGVYVEWPRPEPPTAPLRTDIAGFVGIAERGPLHEALAVDGWSGFRSVFGGHTRKGLLAPSVESFFANGGARAWVVRAADPAAVSWGSTGSLLSGLTVTARTPGSWSQHLTITLVRTGPGRVTLTARLPDGTREVWPALTKDTLGPDSAINDPLRGSRLVSVSDGVGPLGAAPVARARLSGGADGVTTLLPEHLVGGSRPGSRFGLELLDAVREVSIVAIPDLVGPADVPPLRRGRPAQGPDCAAGLPCVPGEPAEEPDLPPLLARGALLEAQHQLVAHCERRTDRVVLLDPPYGLTAEQALSWRREFDSAYAAAYYPWIAVPDRSDKGRGVVRRVPPSGANAGVYAAVSLATGPHAPPANIEFDDVEDLAAVVDDDTHAELNDAGLNALRAIPGRGLRAMGARTTSSDIQWRYVNVRRLMIAIREEIAVLAQPLAFEAAGPPLWRDVDRIARAVLDRVWDRGGLGGATREEAYSVRCDETTNPTESIDAGQVTCELAVRPPWPAEIVRVRVAIRQGSPELIELGAGDG